MVDKKKEESLERKSKDGVEHITLYPKDEEYERKKI